MKSNRPERRTALVSLELARSKVEIAAVSETRFSEQGQLEEVCAGYTFFWSGRPKAERCEAGVAFTTRNDIVGRLPCLSQGLVGHLRTQCTNNPTIPVSTSNSANPPSDTPNLTPGINSITPTLIETISLYSSPANPTTATTPAFAFTTNITTVNDWDYLLNCPQCDRTFTSRISPVGHLRIHRIETGEPVPGAPTHSRYHRLHCTHCPRAFTHRMCLFGHMRIHDSEIHRNADNTDTSCTPSAPAILTATATPLP
ncbi:unnamed protein product [Schistocephalus solidus]|uniref:C2H2-type domain-containing protein n=1 Tax=Schistocephalus solidus TaxID=70667 RepID=A0A183THH9_SCHSO|nr:unnamed protein product [Schistocephalus solidus]